MLNEIELLVARRRPEVLPVVGRFGKLVGELQKEEVRELFQVVPVTHAVVTQGVAEAPDLGDDA